MSYGTVLAVVEPIQAALQNRMTVFQVKQLCWSIVCVIVTELGLEVSARWLHHNFLRMKLQLSSILVAAVGS